MVYRSWAVAVGFLILGTTFITPTMGRTQQPALPPDLASAPTAPTQQEGLDVLARGPIHEAFAEPVDNQPKPSRIVPKQPPAPLEELPPDQKPAGDNVQWIPGYWAWDEDRSDFIWVSGVWRNEPPDRQWMPGHWVQTQGGWQWSPGFWGVQGQQELAFLPPPPAPVLAAPSTPAPDGNSVFIPGTWVYSDTRYLWRPGYWVAYRPGWVWIPAHYVWTPAGVVFVDGYWDFDLGRRGLLFAPAYVQPAYRTRPNWVYRPHFVVGTDFLLGAMFVRPGYAHYYFGDYFETAYRQRGFVAWVDFHRDRFTFDPLFSYYRWQHREDQRWERDLRGLYAARFTGTAPRPPRTLVQQNTLIQNLAINRNVTVTNISTVTALTPLTKVNRSVFQLQPVSREQHLVEQKSIQRLHEVSRQRANLETQIVAKGSAPIRPVDRPHVVKVDVPKPAVPARTSEKPQPPPPPVPTVRPPIHTEPAKPPVVPSRPEIRPSAPLPKIENKVEPKPPAPPQVKPSPVPPPPRPEVKPPPRPEPKPPTVVPRPAPKQEPHPPRPESKPPSPMSSAGSQLHAAKARAPERKL